MRAWGLRRPCPSPSPRCQARGAWPGDKGAGLQRELSPSPPHPAHTAAHPRWLSADYRSIRSDFKGSYRSLNRLIFSEEVRSPCYYTPAPPLETCHSCDPSHPGQPKVRSQAHCASTHRGKVAKAEPCCGAEAPTVIASRLCLLIWTFPRLPWGVIGVIPGDWVTVWLPLSLAVFRASRAQEYDVTAV